MNTCQICGSEMKLIPAGVSKKTGKSYNSFMACPNKCKTPANNTKPQNSDEHIEVMNLIAEEFANLNKRFDQLGLYLRKHLEKEYLPEQAKDDVSIKDIPY